MQHFGGHARQLLGIIVARLMNMLYDKLVASAIGVKMRVLRALMAFFDAPPEMQEVWEERTRMAADGVAQDQRRAAQAAAVAHVGLSGREGGTSARAGGVARPPADGGVEDKATTPTVAADGGLALEAKLALRTVFA